MNLYLTSEYENQRLQPDHQPQRAGWRSLTSWWRNRERQYWDWRRFFRLFWAATQPAASLSGRVGIVVVFVITLIYSLASIIEASRLDRMLGIVAGLVVAIGAVVAIHKMLGRRQLANDN